MKQLKRSKSALLVAAALLATGHAAANPTGPTVTHGSAAIQVSGNVLTVRNSPGTIINWQTFSIGVPDATLFLQQSGNSAVLNRVTGGSPSAILGNLQSNGKVFIANPNGVVFGKTAQVSATSLTATTGHIANESFLAGTATPVGGVTMTVVGRFGGYAALSDTSATFEGVTAPGGSLSITVPGTVTIDGGMTALGDISLAASNIVIAPSTVTIDSGVTAGGDISLVANNMNLSGTLTGTTITLTTSGGVTSGGGISVGGGGVTLTTPGNTSGGDTVTVIPGGTKSTIAIVGGSTASAPPALAATRAVSASGTNVLAVAGRHVAPGSPRPALMVLEKREPLF